MNQFDDDEGIRCVSPSPEDQLLKALAEHKKIPGNGKKDRWETSDARKLLLEALISGEVSIESTATSKPRHVYAQFVVGKEEFLVSDFADAKKFASRLRSLRKIAATKKHNASDDAAVLANTRLKHPKNPLNVHGKPQFKGPPAEKLLKEAITEGLHKQMKPKELYMSHEEFYGVYELEEFRKRIHQELYDRKGVRNMKKANPGKKLSTEKPAM